MTPAAPVPHAAHHTQAPKARTRIGRALEWLAAFLLFPVGLAGATAAWLASRATMPGVITQVTGVSGPSDALTAPGGTYFVAGLAERGSTTEPILVRSMVEYGATLGNRVTYGAVYDDLETFFAEGGERAYVARVVGAGATVGTLVLADRAGPPGVNTLRVDAANAGAWSSSLTVQVADGLVANTFDITLRYAGAIVETYRGLTSPADAASKMAGSAWVVVTNLGSVTAAPSNNPAVIAATALSAGTDDRASVVAGTVTAALGRFGAALGSGAVACPGYPESAVGAAVIAHAAAFNRIALLAPALGTAYAAALGIAASYAAVAGSEGAGIIYPGIRVPDGTGGTRLTTAEGYAAACRTRAHRETGPWRAPAGAVAVTRGHVVDLEVELTDAQGDALNAARVSAIRRIGGAIRLYGWRSLSANEANYRLLTVRDLLNDIVVGGQADLEQYVFAPIDGRGHLFADVLATLDARLAPIADADGLYPSVDPGTGVEVDPGYDINVGPDVNTDDTIAAGEVRALVSVRPVGAAETIRLLLRAVAIGSSI